MLGDVERTENLPVHPRRVSLLELVKSNEFCSHKSNRARLFWWGHACHGGRGEASEIAIRSKCSHCSQHKDVPTRRPRTSGNWFFVGHLWTQGYSEQLQRLNEVVETGIGSSLRAKPTPAVQPPPMRSHSAEIVLRGVKSGDFAPPYKSCSSYRNRNLMPLAREDGACSSSIQVTSIQHCLDRKIYEHHEHGKLYD